MKNHIDSLFISFLLLVLCISCRNNSVIYESFFYNFGENGMTPKAEYIFHPMDDVKNDSLLNIYIAVRYSDLSTLKYLPLDMEFASLDNDSIKNLKIKVPMFDDKNSNEGKGSFGIYETRCLSLQTKKEEGFYISLSTPETDTRGILSLGVICESQNHNP